VNLIVEQENVDYYQIIVVDENFLDYPVMMFVDLNIDPNPIVMLVEILYLTTQKKKLNNTNIDKYRSKHTENGSLPSIEGSKRSLQTKREIKKFYLYQNVQFVVEMIIKFYDEYILE
jgi:hypothetical protein